MNNGAIVGKGILGAEGGKERKAERVHERVEGGEGSSYGNGEGQGGSKD